MSRNDDIPSSHRRRDETTRSATATEPASPDSRPPAQDERVTRHEVLRMGWERVRASGSVAASMALDQVSRRFTPKVQRPPGALPEIDFLLECTRCDLCIEACPPGAILKLGNGAGLAAGTPYLDVNNYRPCVCCKDVPCAAVCPTDALIPLPIEEAYLGTAWIDRDTCIAWNGGECTRCYDACQFKEDAILYDKDGKMYIDSGGCIGCGICVVVCPTRPKSIEVEVKTTL